MLGTLGFSPYIFPMSRAFVKDDDGGESGQDLPDRLISEHPNLVTLKGMEQIEAEVERLSLDYAQAQVSGDRLELQRIARDLRYWSARRSSAQVMSSVLGADEVQFGSVVTIARADRQRQTYQIVGEDEADPARGSISYVSPLAQSLLGKAVGERVAAGAGEAEIISIAQIAP